jgi:putative phage-type endonuclease
MSNSIKIGPVTLIPTDKMSREEWLKLRDLGLGGSDMGTILGYNKYMSATELLYQKLGLHNSSVEENAQMFWGTELEDVIRDKAQYLNLDDQTYIENKRKGHKLRTITKFKYAIQNDNYPWLIGNIDGAINFTRRWWKMDRIAEFKTISRQSAEMWETIPVYHLFQTNHYITLAEPLLREKASVIFYLQDGSKFSGWNIPLVPNLRDEMLEMSYDFWQRVLKGREIVANEKDVDMQFHYLKDYEPAVEATQAYYDFLSEIYKKKQEFKEIEGETNDISAAKMYVKLTGEIRELEEKRQLEKNKIMKRLRDTGANVIHFAGGKITYNKKLYVNVQEN